MLTFQCVCSTPFTLLCQNTTQHTAEIRAEHILQFHIHEASPNTLSFLQNWQLSINCECK